MTNIAGVALERIRRKLLRHRPDVKDSEGDAGKTAPKVPNVLAHSRICLGDLIKRLGPVDVLPCPLNVLTVMDAVPVSVASDILTPRRRFEYRGERLDRYPIEYSSNR